MTASEKTVHVTISGRVQGVWFRAWTKRNAQSLGLAGFVRNRRDGTVEALFSGREADVDEMVIRCSDGPAYADVKDVLVRRVTDSEVAGSDGASFRTLPTE